MSSSERLLAAIDGAGGELRGEMGMTPTDEDRAMLERLAGQNGQADASPSAIEAVTVTLEEFVAIDEAGAGALLGNAENALIPEGGDVMLYGDGGAGKTTLTIDLACHLAAGKTWLEIPVARSARVLLIENEGPRPQLRRKLRRKVNAWREPPLDGRISVLAEPWGQFTFGAPEWRAVLAAVVRRDAIDVVIAGPLTRIGMDAAGTLQEVVAFMEHVADVRHQCDRQLTVILVHHENKVGAVSGAWEGAGDTLLHVQAAGNGRTIVAVQKARWSSEMHGKTLHLAWAEGESFTLEGDRDLVTEIVAYLRERPWRTAKQIAAPEGDPEPGIGANEANVRKLLEAKPERFELRTGDEAKALGRPANAKLYAVSRASDSPDSPTPQSELLGGVEEPAESPSRPLSDSAGDERTPGTDQHGESARPTRRNQHTGRTG